MGKIHYKNIWSQLSYIIGYATIIFGNLIGLIFIFMKNSLDIRLLEVGQKAIGFFIIVGSDILAIPYLFIGNMIRLIADIEYNTRNIDIFTHQIMRIKEYENNLEESNIENME